MVPVAETQSLRPQGIEALTHSLRRHNASAPSPAAATTAAAVSASIRFRSSPAADIPAGPPCSRRCGFRLPAAAGTPRGQKLPGARVCREAK